MGLHPHIKKVLSRYQLEAELKSEKSAKERKKADNLLRAIEKETIDKHARNVLAEEIRRLAKELTVQPKSIAQQPEKERLGFLSEALNRSLLSELNSIFPDEKAKKSIKKQLDKLEELVKPILSNKH
jgi:hypothetical protein